MLEKAMAVVKKVAVAAAVANFWRKMSTDWLALM